MCISPFAKTERLQYVAVASTHGAVILILIAVLQDYNADAWWDHWNRYVPLDSVDSEVSSRTLFNNLQIGSFRGAKWHLEQHETDVCSNPSDPRVYTHPHTPSHNIFQHVHPSLHTITHKQNHTFFTPTCKHFLLYLLPHSHLEIHVHAHKDTDWKCAKPRCLPNGLVVGRKCRAQWSVTVKALEG